VRGKAAAQRAYSLERFSPTKARSALTLRDKASFTRFFDSQKSGTALKRGLNSARQSQLARVQAITFWKENQNDHHGERETHEINRWQLENEWTFCND
jgi:hypothetical protein